MADLDLSPLAHQVAGCHSGTPSNILINKVGQILKPYKPVSNPTFDPKRGFESITEATDLIPVTLNELQFYSNLNSATDDDFVDLRKITPKYFGSKMVNGTDHLLLEDFTHGMQYPCVMDLKIGKDRYYPGRTPEKAKLDTVKYPCLQEFGFCIAGIKICDPKTGQVDLHFMPKITRKFSSDEVADHIRKFLHWGETEGETLRASMLEGGQRVLKWASAQRSLLLRGSSLLFVYDAAGLRGQEAGLDQEAESRGQEAELRSRVGMIDFAHAFHSFGKEDTNYVRGLRNLVEVLRTGRLPR